MRPFKTVRALLLGFARALIRHWKKREAKIAAALEKLQLAIRAETRNKDLKDPDLWAPVLQHRARMPLSDILVKDGKVSAVMGWDEAEILPQAFADWYPGWLLEEGKELQMAYDL
jgi:hypothetical protein